MDELKTATQEQSIAEPAKTFDPAPAAGAISPQSCATCGARPGADGAPPPAYVYVIGQGNGNSITVQHPTRDHEMETRHAIARAGPSKGTDRELMAKLLRDPANKYLVRRFCWVLSVQGVDTYILVPPDGDYHPLIETYRANPQPGDLDIVVGVRGPIAPPSVCNGLLLPIVIAENIYPCSRAEILKSVPKSTDADEHEFRNSVGEVFDRVTSRLDNAGATDCDRAWNFAAVTSKELYAIAARHFANNASLTGMECVPSPLSGDTRKIVSLALSFTERSTGFVSKFGANFDVSGPFPFQATPWGQRVDH